VNLAEARKVPGADPGEPFLSMMIKALSSPVASFLNSPEDIRRLEAAKVIRAADRKAGRRK
jgi:hypothetical protein